MAKLGMSYMDVVSEKAIVSLLYQCLSDEETLVLDEHFDLVAPKGVRKLDWPEKTAIEIKPNMIYDTLDRVRSLYDLYGANYKLVVVVSNDISAKFFTTKRPTNGLHGRNIEVVHVDILFNRAAVDSEGANTTKRNEDEIIKEKARIAIKNGKISLFLGAGVSASAGVVTWDKLLENLCIKRHLAKLDSDIPDIIKGRHIVNMYTDKANKLSPEFNKDIREILYANYDPSTPSPLIKSITKIVNGANIESIISYNYDDILEQALSADKCLSVYDKSRPSKEQKIQVYHVHGFISHDDKESPIVLGEKEYHKIYEESYNWGNVEQLHALCRSTCFFIGLSMKDPNLRRLLDISLDGGEMKAVHFAFLRRIEFNIPFTEAILSSLGVNCIWYEQHEDLPKLIQSLL